MKISKAELKKRVFSDWRYFLGFGFGSGLIPKCPGTWGTLVTIPIVYCLSWLPLYVYIFLTVLLFYVGARVSQTLSEDLGVHDYGGVNIDEVVGFLCVMFPFSCTGINIMIGFVLFRLLDILKPFPISWVDKHIEGGYGMMLDDIVAAFFAVLMMYPMTIWIN